MYTPKLPGCRRDLVILCIVIAVLVLFYFYAYKESVSLNKSIIYTYTSMQNLPLQYSNLKHQMTIDTKIKKGPLTTIQDLGTGVDHVVDKDKYFIYRCDAGGMQVCGGWADRIKGIIAAYLLANITGRTFKVEVLDPDCDLRNYLVPNDVNWSLPQTFHTYVRESSNVQIINGKNSSSFYWGLKDIDFRKLVSTKAQFVYFKANLEYTDGFRNQTVHKKSLSWMKHLTRDKIVSGIYSRLFKLSDQLQRKLDVFLQEGLKTYDNKLICAQLRIGRNPTNPNDDVKMSKLFAPNVWKFLNNYSSNPTHKFFVMSDSQDIIRQASQQSFRDNLLATPGEMLHIERSRNVGSTRLCPALEKVILEFHLLTYCDVLLVCDSGLSRMAAYLRGSSKGLFCLLYDGRIIPCRPDNIKDLYNDRG